MVSKNLKYLFNTQNFISNKNRSPFIDVLCGKSHLWSEQGFTWENFHPWELTLLPGIFMKFHKGLQPCEVFLEILSNFVQVISFQSFTVSANGQTC